MGQIIINQNFNNFEKLVSRLSSWDADFLQIEKGPFSANLIQYISGELLFTRASFNRRLFQQGAPPNNRWTFAITGSSETHLNFKGHEINNQSLMIYPPGSEINAISQSRFDILTFSAPEHLLELLTQKNELSGFRHHFKNIEVLTCEKDKIEMLRFFLIHLFIDIKKSDVKINGPHKKLWLETIIPEVLLSAIYHQKNSTYIHRPFRLRDGAFKQALACIQAFAKEDLTVKGLVHQTGVSQRTLEYVFKENLGISPKQFIRNFRLNRVRQELTRSNHLYHKVTDIAFGWSFLHMGQFSKDYKALFGELPSTTLKKS